MRGKYRWVVAALFIVYMAVLFYLVFMADAYGRTNQEILRYQNMNFKPFRTIVRYTSAWGAVEPMVIITNIYGNILAFLPFGLLGPLVLRRLRKFRAVFFYSFLLSLIIELVQGYLGVGVMDVDDLILNVLGGVIGYGCYSIFFRLFIKKQKQEP